jgi:phosphoribulokinase
MVVEGLLRFHTATLRDVYDVRVYLDPPEELRRSWKVQRDCARRGYTADEVLEQLDRREEDAAAYIRPQRRHSDIEVSFMPGDPGDQDHLDAHIVLRPGLPHPDLSPFVGDGITVAERGGETHLWVSGAIGRRRAAAVEEAVWDRMHFASHLLTERLGEFTVGTQLHRSQALAIVQVLVLHQLVTARAAVAVGRPGSRNDRARSPAPA